MKHSFRITGIILALILAGVLTLSQGPGRPHPALAEGACPGPAAGVPTVMAVQPRHIDSTIGATITVSGTNFEDTSIVILEDYGALATACANPTLLTAVVPPGIPGSYDGKTYRVQVVNSLGTSSEDVRVRVMIPVPTGTPAPTDTPAPTAFVRPVLTVQSYGASLPVLTPGQDIDFEMTLQNSGRLAARDVVVTFTAGDLIPRATGGVLALGNIRAGEASRFFQPFITSPSLTDRIATLQVDVRYNDEYGTSYTETFSLTFNSRVPVSGGAPSPTPTPTHIPGNRPQIVIQGYQSGDEQLKPGAIFDLTLNIKNLGMVDAQDVTMIIGGGTIQDGGEGTPSPGGVQGGSGEFGQFAPLGSSNVQFLDDIASGASRSASQQLVVNVSTTPGAYPFKISFTYTNPDGQRFTDEQVVTLLVYQPPQIDIDFYRDPNPIFAGQPSPLPIQIINLGRSSAVLGVMEITAEGAQVTENTVLVGLLDAGGFFTLDALLMADQPGPLNLTVTVKYNDDFNQPREIRTTLDVEVQEAPDMGPFPEGEGFEPPPMEQETFWQKIWRFIRGLLGLDSARRTPQVLPGGEMPIDEPGGMPIYGPKGP